MGIFSNKLENALPVVEKHYRLGRSGIVKKYVQLKNNKKSIRESDQIPYVKTVMNYLETNQGLVPKRVLLVGENENLAIKAAALIMENYKEFQDENGYDEDLIFDDYDDYDDYGWGDEDAEVAENEMLCVLSLKRRALPEKTGVNAYIPYLMDIGKEQTVLFTGICIGDDMGEKLETIGACPSRMQFIYVKPEQVQESWVQELLVDFHCDALYLSGMQTDYYERVLTYLLKDSDYKLGKELSPMLLVHRIRKRRGLNFSEEDLAWYLDGGVECIEQSHPKSKVFKDKDFQLLSMGDKHPLKQLLEMTGMKSVKEMAKEYAAIVQEELRNRELGILGKNMIFLGNPGTGKTTCAKLLAEVMSHEGHSNANFVVATRKDLIGEYVGHTAPKVAVKFEEARGGILFVDEAGFFLNTGAGGFVDEAIKEFVRYMEIYPDVTVIFAMYSKEAQEFLELDPGLSSRISRFVYFEDYTDEELCSIGRDMLRQRGYTLEAEAEDVLKEYMSRLRRDKKKNFGNAREVRKLVESAIIVACVQKYRNKNRGNCITAADIREGWNRLQQESVKRQEIFGFGSRCAENKVLCQGR